MIYLAIFIAGIIAARWLIPAGAALARTGVFAISIIIAYRLTAIAVPELAAVDTRGVWSGLGIGMLIGIAGIGAWFYALGWRGRVAATEADDVERARQKAIKDRKVA